MNCDLDTPLPDWIIEHPETTSVFSQLGLDISCGGKSLQYVCRHQGLNPTDVLKQLQTILADCKDDDRGGGEA
ncbi:regulator of cell morphogenesis and NO signaling [Neorhodopirellula lusitana]|uniref:Regulator of cell morphogenesis and NO signaling n=1 Tax=Neorhodopirellula lusitana TaxID=445327 RepID=A0ABY1Q7B0_9BACT|nr:DUF542 domain-containing protein [Neorhodopirellula lusitana]SMP61617.1 regulator of cell morphogenesis and NO signaling [Neorhodopirellula lusitana]